MARKRGRFYYRRRIPKTGSEVMVALRTGDYREAQHLCKLLDRIFFRSASMHAPHDLHAILRRELVLAIESDRQRHIATPYGMPVCHPSCS